MKELLILVCSAAAVTDILWRRVPNWWLGIDFFAGVFLCGSSGLPAVWSYLLRAIAVALIGLPIWKRRMIGAGDVKLCSVMAAGLGICAFLSCFVCSLFFGAFMAVCRMLFCQSFFQRVSYFRAWFGQCLSKREWLPYLGEAGIEKKDTIPFSAALFCGYVIWLVM